jgi:hypothetical protein
MPRFTVQNGKRYQATINLGFFQAAASNDMVADEFRKVGFSDVTVTGSGRTRHAVGSWTQGDRSADIPDEVGNIQEIGQIEI